MKKTLRTNLFQREKGKKGEQKQAEAASGMNPRKLFSIRQMFLGVFLGLGLGALFSSGCLVDLAERQGIGGTRNVALGAANAVDRAANFLSLNRPSDGLSMALGRDTGGTGSEAARELLETATLPDPSEPSNPQRTSATPPSVGSGEQDSGEDDAGSEGDGTTENTNGGGRTGRTKNPGGRTTTASSSPTATSSGKETPSPTGKTDVTTTSDPATGTQPPGTTEVSPPGTTTSPPTSPTTTAKATPPGEAGNGHAPNTTKIATGNPPPPPSPDPPATPSTSVNPPSPPPPSPDPPVCPSTQAENLPDEEFAAPRTPTPEEPLRIFVGGDSIGRNLADGLQRLAPRELTEIEIATRHSTGLSRPDYYDWPARLAKELTENRPDVIVLMFGANDFQNVMYNGRALNRFKQEWTDLYCQRVAQAMRLVSQPGVQTIWVGQPIVRESTLANGLALLNSVYKAQALLHPSVTFVDTWSVFSTPDGEYAQSLDGVRLRDSDGVHMTIAGSNRLSSPAWEQIASAWGLES